ncbi:unnamed protein product, partial [Peniophora sp. CBMAI 1063]
MSRQALSYGQIADGILPSIVLSVRDRDTLKGVVEDFVALDAREHQEFFRQQMSRIWPTPIDWKARPHEKSFLDQWSHLVTLSVPEVGMFNPPRVYEFFQDFGLLKQPLVKEVDMTETLKALFGTVNRATGQLDEDAYPAMLQAKSRLKRKITYRIQPQEHFVGRNELLLDASAWDEEVFYKEAIPMVYRIVTTAHANISKYRDLDPVWTDWDEMVDDAYHLDGIPMRLPTALGRDNCFKYLRHWFNLGRLEFRRWRRKNGLMMDPVEFEDRWWIDSYRSADAEDLEPMRIDASIPTAALAVMNDVPRTSANSGADRTAPRVQSQYGSASAVIHRVHDESFWDEELIEWMDMVGVSDPDDAQPQAVLTGEVLSSDDWCPPCLVPSNPEARAQWCLHHLQQLPSSMMRSCRSLRAGLCKLAELPLVPNAFFSLKAASKFLANPDTLRWDMAAASAPTSDNVEGWVRFLTSQPWNFNHKGSSRFSGLEMAWVFVLGSILYLRGYATSGGSGRGRDGVDIFTLSPHAYSSLFTAFDNAMEALTGEYSYPGRPPSMKYGVVSTRSHYLAYLLKDNDALVRLLRSVIRM